VLAYVGLHVKLCDTVTPSSCEKACHEELQLRTVFEANKEQSTPSVFAVSFNQDTTVLHNVFVIV